MHALILAGGKGVRLKPYTVALPKALVPVVDLPILEIVLRQLKFYGIQDITLSVGHLAELIEAFFGNGKKLGLNIHYLIEDEPLGTAGPIKLCEHLPENFIVMNADILTDLNYLDIMDFHLQSNNLATIAVAKRYSAIDFGIIHYNAQSQVIKAFEEKPTLAHHVSMGIYAFNQKIRDYIPSNQFYGFDQLMLQLVQEKAPLKAYPFEGYWLDIGRPDDYEKAQGDFETHKVQFLPELSHHDIQPSLQPSA